MPPLELYAPLRFISARAENTIFFKVHRFKTPVHLRACGEHWSRQD